jgi:hypothetical protein
VEYVQNAEGMIVVRGTEAGIADVRNTVRVMDAPKASLQAVRVTIKAEFTATPKGGKPKVYKAATSAVGFVDEKMPLDLSIGSNRSDRMDLALSLVPSMVDSSSGGERGRVSLTGNGSIRANLPMELSRSVSVGVSVPLGGQAVIASGDAQFPTGNVQFKVTVSVTTDRSTATSAKTKMKSTKLVPPDHQSITDYTVLIGVPQDRPFVENWNAAERSIIWRGFDTMRWSRFGSKLRLPVQPGRKYALTVDVHVPQAAFRPGSGIFLGSQKICGIGRSGNIKVSGLIPAQKTGQVVLTVECANWRPTDYHLYPEDPRELGVAVRSVSLEAVSVTGRRK